MKLDGRDWATAIALAALAFTLNIIGLDSLEYFRFTEADRTLIAWEMYESGDYLVPRLLHSVILTKPPLYYWVLAGSMHIFGGVSEWIARFPSVLYSALFAMLQFAVMRKAGGTRELAILSALVLICSFTFFQQSSVAEIDLVYGLLSAAAFSLAYFAVERKSMWILLSAYAAAGVAFLAKGPPVIFFFAAGHTIFTLCRLRGERNDQPRHPERSEGPSRPPSTSATILRLVAQNLAGLLVFLAIILTWLALLTQSAEVSWPDLAAQFKTEVLDRALKETHNPRGPFYYVGTFTAGLAPWSPIFYAGIILLFLHRRKKLPIPAITPPPLRTFALFNAVYFGAGFLMLSIADGKSIRYLFPVYFCAAHLTAIFLPLVLRSAIMPWFYRLAALLGGVVSLGVLATMFRFKIPGVETETLLTAAMVLAFASAFLAWSAVRRNARETLAAIVLVMFAVRIGTTTLFYPYRNSIRSVRPIVERVDELMPQGAVLYNIELFERWINYYLKHRGRESYRLSPEEAASPRTTNGRAYLLLHTAEEGWRVDQLREVDPTVKVLQEFSRRKNRFLFVEADAAKLAYLKPREFFPTKPSPPYYNDPAKAGTVPPAPEHDN